MGRSLSIFQKGIFLIAIPLLFQLALIAAVAWMQGQNAEAQQFAHHSQEILTQGHAVLATMVDGQTGVRGWVLTNDRGFAEPFERATREVTGQFAQLRNQVQDPDQKVRVEQVEAKAAALLAWYAEMSQLMQNGQRDEAIARVKTGQGQRRMDELRGEMAIFLEEQKVIDTARHQVLEQFRRGLNWLLLAGGLASFLTTGILALVFAREISGRLAILAENARRLTQGEELTPPVAGKDEIARVDHALHDTARDLRHAERLLRDQVQMLESILNNIGDGVAVSDERGVFLVFNPAAERILGRPRADAGLDGWSEHFGIYLSDGTTRMLPHDLPLARAMRGEAVDAGIMRVRHAHRPDEVWVSATARPLQDQDGHARGGVVVFRDVTAEKRFEEKTRQINAELERRVAERTAELAEVNRDLAHKNQENEMFVYSVSHDLRSPLVNLQGFSKELDKGCHALTALFADESLPPTVREQGTALLKGKMAKSLGFIQTAVLRLSGIIDALLRLSRIGRVEYRRERVNVARLVERVVGATQGTITERGARVTVGDLPPAMGDRTAVEQVFANLVGNALTYLDPARPGEIEIGCLPPGADGVADGFRAYFVRDNGLGVAERHRSKIFQVFQRAHPHVGRGEGMGLAIVTRVTERHRGRAWVESKVGEGSTFFVTLPAAAVEDN